VLRHLDLGRALVALGALLVLVALFLDFFEVGGSGWEVFEALDLVLAGLAAAALYGALRPAPGTGREALRLVPALLFVVLLVQLLQPPPAAADSDPDTGAWLALAGSLLVLAGAVLELLRISVRIDVAGRDGRPVTVVGAREPAPAEAPTTVVPASAPAGDGAVPGRSLFGAAGPREVPAVDRRAERVVPGDPDPTQPMDPATGGPAPR
jgi:hypothetical protein